MVTITDTVVDPLRSDAKLPVDYQMGSSPKSSPNGFEPVSPP